MCLDFDCIKWFESCFKQDVMNSFHLEVNDTVAVIILEFIFNTTTHFYNNNQQS